MRIEGLKGRKEGTDDRVLQNAATNNLLLVTSLIAANHFH